jgi:two-component system OmpR family response regulator
MLPDIDGFEIARELGSTGHRVPVLFLTARDSTSDKIRGLSVGGDDYVTKPFSLEEVMARIHAILRRTQPESHEESRVAFADLVMDLDTREVWRGERQVELTDTEFRLLRYLMMNPRRVLTRGQILDHVWDYDFGGDANVLDTYIHYLRRKLDAGAPRLIQTVRGVGYSMRLPPENS